MTREKLNVGVIGMGCISEAHAPRYKAYPRANLYAICDTDTSWLPDAAKLYEVEKAYADYHEMLADPNLDAVSICLPTRLHAQVTIDALKAGKHVLCEKPMSTTAEEAYAMQEAAKESGKKLMISHNQRLEANVQYMKKLAEEGFFGDIYLMRVGWRRPMGMMPPHIMTRPNGTVYNRNFFNEKDNGGGVLRDLASHLLDLSLYITDFPKPLEVASSLYRAFYPDDYQPEKYVCDSEDMAVGHITFDNGLTMQTEFSYGSQIAEELIFTEVYGTKGGASRRGNMLKIMDYRDGSTSIRPVYVNDTRYTQHEFVDAILDHKEVLIPPSQGIPVIELIDRLYANAGEIKQLV